MDSTPNAYSTSTGAWRETGMSAIPAEARTGGSAPDNSPHIPTQTMLSLRDVAVICQVSVKTIRRAIADGRLKAKRAGHSLRVWPEDLHAWLNGQTHTTESDRSHAPRKRPAARPGGLRELLED